MGMQTARRLDRRTFLADATLAGGGLIVAIALPGCTRRAGETAPTAPTAPGASSPPQPAAASTALNAYVRVGTDGRVTLVMPKVEMGQGAYTGLAMLLAEELDIELVDVVLEAAPADPKTYGYPADQSTGTSTSIMYGWLPLRQAGATARALLVAAAARRWGIAATACETHAGNVEHAASGRMLSYGELVADAAKLPPPAKVALKDPKAFRLIGTSLRRLDTPSKVDGSARYGIDLRLPGLKMAAVELAPVAGAKLLAIAEPQALAVKGVRKVVRLADAVAVIADHSWAARQGLKALAARWDAGANASLGQSVLEEELEAAMRRPGVSAARSGDVAHAMAGAVQRVEAIYRQPLLAHAALEPMNCTVHWQAGNCEVWAGTQAPDRVVHELAALGLSPGQIRVHSQLIGGGFGRHLDVDGIVLAARIAREYDAPVQMLWSREDDMRHDVYRPAYVDRIAAGLDAHGRPVAWTHTFAGSSVDARWYYKPQQMSLDADAANCVTEPPYALPNRSVAYVRQEPRGFTTGYWRGVGATRNLFVVESFIDELALAAGQDPLAYRRALLTDARLAAVLELAAAKSGWGRPLPRGAGRGVAIGVVFGSYIAEVVEVSVNADRRLRVERVVCALDCGQCINPGLVRQQMEGGVLFAASAALYGEITLARGRIEQGNFDRYRVLRHAEAPPVETHLVASDAAPGGIGEVGTACFAPALGNAIHAATGTRVRRLPVARSMPTLRV